MTAQSNDKKTFLLSDDGRQLGALIYENLFFLNAEIKLVSSDVYKIKPVGFFQTSIYVTKNGADIAKLLMNWRGEIVISCQDGQEYVLKLNKFFFSKYIIENRNGENIIQLAPQFNWRAFQYNYDIAYNMSSDDTSKDPLLLLLGVYAANYFVACMSGASAGMI